MGHKKRESFCSTPSYSCGKETHSRAGFLFIFPVFLKNVLPMAFHRKSALEIRTLNIIRKHNWQLATEKTNQKEKEAVF